MHIPMFVYVYSDILILLICVAVAGALVVAGAFVSI